MSNEIEKDLWDKSFDWGDLKSASNFVVWMLVALAMGLVLGGLFLHPV